MDALGRNRFSYSIGVDIQELNKQAERNRQLRELLRVFRAKQTVVRGFGLWRLVEMDEGDARSLKQRRLLKYAASGSRAVEAWGNVLHDAAVNVAH